MGQEGGVGGTGGGSAKHEGFSNYCCRKRQAAVQRSKVCSWSDSSSAEGWSLINTIDNRITWDCFTRIKPINVSVVELVLMVRCVMAMCFD